MYSLASPPNETVTIASFDSLPGRHTDTITEAIRSGALKAHQRPGAIRASQTQHHQQEDLITDLHRELFVRKSKNEDVYERMLSIVNANWPNQSGVEQAVATAIAANTLYEEGRMSEGIENIRLAHRVFYSLEHYICHSGCTELVKRLNALLGTPTVIPTVSLKPNQRSVAIQTEDKEEQDTQTNGGHGHEASAAVENATQHVTCAPDIRSTRNGDTPQTARTEAQVTHHLVGHQEQFGHQEQSRKAQSNFRARPTPDTTGGTTAQQDRKRSSEASGAQQRRNPSARRRKRGW